MFKRPCVSADGFNALKDHADCHCPKVRSLGLMVLKTRKHLNKYPIGTDAGLAGVPEG